MFLGRGRDTFAPDSPAAVAPRQEGWAEGRRLLFTRLRSSNGSMLWRGRARLVVVQPSALSFREFGGVCSVSPRDSVRFQPSMKFGMERKQVFLEVLAA